MPKRALSTREAVFAKSVLTDTESSLGKTAASLVLPCPPCIALAAPGEVINGELINLLKAYGINEIAVVK